MIKSGFSKLSKEQKIDWVLKKFFNSRSKDRELLSKYLIEENLQKIHDDFSENTISNFISPFSIAPNFIIDKKNYTIPMVTEESSVVAAACNAAKFWYERGGFETEIVDFIKSGQVHFKYDGPKKKLSTFFKSKKKKILDSCSNLTKNMKMRGGGILEIKLIDKTSKIKNYYQLHAEFNTVDSMGANFINSCLEQLAVKLKSEFNKSSLFTDNYKIEIIMSILSNYTPKCLVRAKVNCKINDLKSKGIEDSKRFAEKFVEAVNIANADINRAVTHNKGIMNGIDAVVIATGNDFRAVEASAHSYAARDGNYSSLTKAKIEKNHFKYWIEIPISIGTIGGITNLHPLVKWSLRLLNNPGAEKLMRIIAVSGLAQNFAAIKSLITTGIQQGHMKMHLTNILNTLDANENEKKTVIEYFKKNKVNYNKVEKIIKKLRKK